MASGRVKEWMAYEISTAARDIASQHIVEYLSMQLCDDFEEDFSSEFTEAFLERLDRQDSHHDSDGSQGVQNTSEDVEDSDHTSEDSHDPNNTSEDSQKSHHDAGEDVQQLAARLTTVVFDDHFSQSLAKTFAEDFAKRFVEGLAARFGFSFTTNTMRPKDFVNKMSEVRALAVRIAKLYNPRLPLFRLPLAVRTRIYDFVLVGHAFHVNRPPFRKTGPFNRPLFLNLCEPKVDEIECDETVEHRDDSVNQLQHGSTARHFHCYRSRKWLPSLALLSVCHQIHDEAFLLPFSKNTFIFHDDDHLELYVGQLLPYQRNAIARIVLRPQGMSSHRSLEYFAAEGHSLPQLTDLVVIGELDAKILTPDGIQWLEKNFSQNEPFGNLLNLYRSPLVNVNIVVRCKTEDYQEPDEDGRFQAPPVQRPLTKHQKTFVAGLRKRAREVERRLLDTSTGDA